MPNRNITNAEKRRIGCTGFLLRGVLELRITTQLIHKLIAGNIQKGIRGMTGDILEYGGEKYGVEKGVRFNDMRKRATNLRSKLQEELVEKTEQRKEAESAFKGLISRDSATVESETAAKEAMTAARAVEERILARIKVAESFSALDALPIIGWAIEATVWLVTALSILSFIDFGILNVGFEDIMAGAFCNIAEAQDDLTRSNCANGKWTGSECVACKQIYNMKNYDDELKSKYNKPGKKNYANVIGTSEPAMAGKLTKLSCSNKNDEPLYAKRPFPIASCVYWDYGAAESRATGFGGWDGLDISKFPKDKGLDDFSFLLSSDVNTCRDERWSIPDDPEPAKPPRGGQLRPKQLKYLHAPSPQGAECQGIGKYGHGELIDEVFNGNVNWKCAWNHDWRWGVPGVDDVNLADWAEKGENLAGEEWSSLFGDDEKPNLPQLINTDPDLSVSTYDGPNVCNDRELELVGDIYNNISKPQDPTNIARNRDKKTYVSNHCCPKIVGAGKCPPYPDNITVDSRSSPGDFDPMKNPYSDSIDNCYVYDYKYHPEFLPKNIHDNLISHSTEHIAIPAIKSNKSIDHLRRGGIQCGPKDETISSTFNSTDNETATYDYGGEEVLDVIRANDNKETQKRTSTDPGNYYGTRFKLHNNYKYDSTEDSGATGYENYLDPMDYVHLPCHDKTGTNNSSSCDDYYSKFFNVGWEKGPGDLYTIDKYTTVNDVIARENGHPDRMKPLCDNYECNDLEKTKYMQTVYDGFCKNYNPDTWQRDIYKKFYRPAGIYKYDEKVVDGKNLEKYSDMCCDPILYSNKWSFVGCDADGKNPYFIDNIIQDYQSNPSSVTVPSENGSEPRKRIDPQPGSKLNLNQCIPSAETRCNVSRAIGDEYRVEGDFHKNSIFFNYTEMCNNKLDYEVLQSFKSDSSPLNGDLETVCGGDCMPYVPAQWSDSDLVKSLSSPDPQGGFLPLKLNNSASKGEYWHYDRYSEGYVPIKGNFNNWRKKSEESLSSFELTMPQDVYTQCSPIPPELKINDIEIYDKRIDWVPDGPHKDKLRFNGAGGDTPPPQEDMFKIICKSYGPVNNNNIPSSPIRETGDDGNYYYGVKCVAESSPTYELKGNVLSKTTTHLIS